MLTSPLTRARETCGLAGFGDRAEISTDLREWDYGVFEGRRTSDIRDEIPGWSVWTHEITNGESLAEVTAHADRVIEDLLAEDGLTLLFSHAHLLRVLAARWCGFEAPAGQHLVVDAPSVSVLGGRARRAGDRALEPVSRRCSAGATISEMSADGSPTS